MPFLGGGFITLEAAKGSTPSPATAISELEQAETLARTAVATAETRTDTPW